MAARDVTLLVAAIHRATGELNLAADDENLTAAQALLEELASESDTLRAELNQAEAAVKRGGGRKSVAAQSFGGRVNASSMISNEALEKKAAELFDTDKSSSEFDLARYPELRSSNAFAAGSMFNKKALKQNMLKYTRDVIPKSLTLMDDDSLLTDKAIELFKSLQGFTLDRHYSFPDTLVCELIDEILLWPSLRDELYIQTLKQMNGNTREESYLRCWQLLSLLSEFVPPSDELIPFVLHFILEQITVASGGAQPAMVAAGFILATSPASQKAALQYGQYVQNTLRETYLKFRYVAPQRGTQEHIDAVARKEAGKHTPYVGVDHVTAFRERTMEPNDVTVCFPDGSRHTLKIAPWQKNHNLIKQLAAVAAIRDIEGLALFELRGVTAQYLYPHECLLDFQMQWEKMRAKSALLNARMNSVAAEAAPQSKLSSILSFLSSTKSKLLDSTSGAKKEEDDDWSSNTGAKRFLLKRRVFGKPVGESKDAMAVRLMYAQTARECALGYHNIEEPIATTLAAVTRILSETGQADALGPQPAELSHESTVDLFHTQQLWDCPLHLIARRVEPKRFAKNVEKIRPEIKAASLEAYLHEARKLSTFGAQFYNVERADDNTPRKLPLELVLAVNYYGIYLLDSKTRQELDSYALLNVLGWSSSSVRIVVKVKLIAPAGSQSSTTQPTGTATFRFNTHSPRMGREICDLLLNYANEMMKQVTASQQQQTRK